MSDVSENIQTLTLKEFIEEMSKEPVATVKPAAPAKKVKIKDLPPLPDDLMAGAPEARWVAIDKLKLGPNRHPLPNHLDKITRNFDARYAGTLTVAKCTYNRDQLSVCDGMHRYLAGKERKVKGFWCFIVPCASPQEEYILWTKYNQERRGVNRLNIYHQKLRGGDPDALALDDDIRVLTGRKVATVSSGGTLGNICCIGSVEIAYRENRDACRVALSVTDKICKSQIFHQAIFRGVFGLERRLVDASLQQKDLTAKLLRIGYEPILRRMLAELDGGSGNTANDKRHAAALLELLNHKKKRSHRLVARGINDRDD